MKTEFNFKEFKVGDAVYNVTRGWTTIETIEKDYFEVENDGCAFFLDGKVNTTDSLPTIYPYNPFEMNRERVVEVRNRLVDDWEKRVLFAQKEGKAICWADAKNLDESKTETNTCSWSYWREIQPQKELTFEEKVNILWEKYETELWILKLKK